MRKFRYNESQNLFQFDSLLAQARKITVNSGNNRSPTSFVYLLPATCFFNDFIAIENPIRKKFVRVGRGMLKKIYYILLSAYKTTLFKINV